MSERNPNNPYGGSLSGPIDKRIGDAFPIIEAVYSKLSQLAYLADNLESSQTKQIVLRGNENIRAIEWQYEDESWNILVPYEELFGIDKATLFQELEALFNEQSQELQAKVNANEQLVLQGGLILSQIQDAASNIDGSIVSHVQRGDHDDRYLRKGVIQEAPLLTNIQISGVAGLSNRLSELELAAGSNSEAASFAARMAIVEAIEYTPIFDQIFSYNNAPLDPRLFFQRNSPSSFIENGQRMLAGFNEPVYENSALRLSSGFTNYALGDLTLSQPIGCTVDVAGTYGLSDFTEYKVTANTSTPPPTLRIAQLQGPNKNRYSVQTTVSAGSRNTCTIKLLVFPTGVNDPTEKRVDFSLVSEGSILFQTSDTVGKITKLVNGKYQISMDLSGLDYAKDLIEAHIGFSSGTSGGETLFFSNPQVNDGGDNAYLWTWDDPKVKLPDEVGFYGSLYFGTVNPLQGSIVLDFAASADTDDCILAHAQSNTAGVYLRNEDSKHRLSVMSDDSTEVGFLETDTLIDPEARDRVVVSWKGQLLYLYHDGVEYGPISNAFIDTNSLIFGSLKESAWVNLYRLRIYPRMLGKEQAEALTAM